MSDVTVPSTFHLDNSQKKICDKKMMGGKKKSHTDVDKTIKTNTKSYKYVIRKTQTYNFSHKNALKQEIYDIKSLLKSINNDRLIHMTDYELNPQSLFVYSALEFSNMTKKEVRDSFIEFKKFPCKYVDCMHTNEEECHIKKAVMDHEIMPFRYENYLKFIEDALSEQDKYKRK